MLKFNVLAINFESYLKIFKDGINGEKTLAEQAEEKFKIKLIKKDKHRFPEQTINILGFDVQEASEWLIKKVKSYERYFVIKIEKLS